MLYLGNVKRQMLDRLSHGALHKVGAVHGEKLSLVVMCAIIQLPYKKSIPKSCSYGNLLLPFEMKGRPWLVPGGSCLLAPLLRLAD